MQREISAWAAAHPATSAVVWRIDEGVATPVAAHRPGAPRIPASTMKLVTATGALVALGRDHRFETRLVTGSRTRLSGDVLIGNLHLRGGGDPLLSTGAYSRRHLAGRGTIISSLLRPLRRQGVRRIRGAIVADEGLFDRRRVVPGWPARYRAYASPLSAIATNQAYAGNARAAYVGDPPLAAARRLRGAMRGLGMRHVGRLVRGGTPATGTLLGVVRSERLATIVRAMNVDSDNFIAETLAKGIAAADGRRGTTAAGVALTAERLVELGILTAGDRAVDGSGLSRANRLRADSLARLITVADADRTWGRALIGSLPRGGEGTLVRRLREPAVRRRVRAKTGFLNNVTTIAGRVVSRRGERYAVAIMMATPRIEEARAVQDRVIRLLAAGSEDPL